MFYSLKKPVLRKYRFGRNKTRINMTGLTPEHIRYSSVDGFSIRADFSREYKLLIT